MPSEILLVDDDPNVRETTSDLLGFTGALVHTAASGNEARRFLEAQDVNLVITDLSMPDGDGKSLLTWIRSSPRHRNLKVVIMSAHAQREDIKMGLEAGADQYLTKPFDPASFITQMKQHLASPGRAPTRSRRRLD
jgi:DNA-binding response OmpR family regulator